MYTPTLRTRVKGIKEVLSNWGRRQLKPLGIVSVLLKELLQKRED